MGQNTKTVTDMSFDADVLSSDKPVLVDFWAEWCGPCKALAPTLDALAQDFDGRLTVAKANLDEAGDAANKAGVRTIPLLVLFEGGKEKARWTRGNAPKAVLQEWLEGQL